MRRSRVLVQTTNFGETTGLTAITFKRSRGNRRGRCRRHMSEPGRDSRADAATIRTCRRGVVRTARLPSRRRRAAGSAIARRRAAGRAAISAGPSPPASGSAGSTDAAGRSGGDEVRACWEDGAAAMPPDPSMPGLLDLLDGHRAARARGCRPGLPDVPGAGGKPIAAGRRDAPAVGRGRGLTPVPRRPPHPAALRPAVPGQERARITGGTSPATPGRRRRGRSQCPDRPSCRASGSARSRSTSGPPGYPSGWGVTEPSVKPSPGERSRRVGQRHAAVVRDRQLGRWRRRGRRRRRCRESARGSVSAMATGWARGSGSACARLRALRQDVVDRRALVDERRRPADSGGHRPAGTIGSNASSSRRAGSGPRLRAD